MPAAARLIGTADSVTRLGDVSGKVLIAGSHGGIIAAYLGAIAGPHALILNDAGLGKDRAGIAALFYLESIGMAAAAVDCMSARIGDGRSMWKSGLISHVNAAASPLGIAPGMNLRQFASLVAAAQNRR